MSPAAAPLQAGRTLFGRTVYPRMVEIIQLLGTSSWMALPAEADFETPLAPAVDQYLSTDTANARDRARWFHLVWDVSCSAFAGRQVLYERMFGGNPVRHAMTLFHTYDKAPFRQRVHTFMQSVDGKGGINCRAPAVVDAARPAHAAYHDLGRARPPEVGGETPGERLLAETHGEKQKGNNG